MKYTLSLLVLLLVACKTDKIAEKAQSEAPLIENSISTDIELDVFDYNGLEPYLNKTDDKTYVVNFWATWCAPCIKELPYFETLNAQYAGQNVEVLLVSLDFPSQYEKKLKPFIKKHDLKSKILVLDDVDQNNWIPKINENWDGAIPVTIIYNRDKRKFYDQTFTYEELETELKQFLK